MAVRAGAPSGEPGHGSNIAPDSDAATVRAVCDRLHVHAPAEASAGHLVLALYDELVEPHTVQPTFYMDFPVETSPLTRVHRHNLGWPSGGTSSRSATRSAPPTPS